MSDKENMFVQKISTLEQRPSSIVNEIVEFFVTNKFVRTKLEDNIKNLEDASWIIG